MYPNSIYLILGPQSTQIGTTLRPKYIYLDTWTLRVRGFGAYKRLVRRSGGMRLIIRPSLGPWVETYGASQCGIRGFFGFGWCLRCTNDPNVSLQHYITIARDRLGHRRRRRHSTSNDDGHNHRGTGKHMNEKLLKDATGRMVAVKEYSCFAFCSPLRSQSCYAERKPQSRLSPHNLCTKA